MSLIRVDLNFKEKLAELKKELNLTNQNALPTFDKVSVNVGIGSHRSEKTMVEYITATLAKITGQKAVPTKVRKSVAGFKVRAGEVVGLRVTLRGTRMYDFISRLLNITLPRIREFRGIPTSSFDKNGNLTIGFKDQGPFAELGHDALDRPFGLSVTISIKRSSAESSEIFLRTLGFPIKNK